MTLNVIILFLDLRSHELQLSLFHSFDVNSPIIFTNIRISYKTNYLFLSCFKHTSSVFRNKSNNHFRIRFPVYHIEVSLSTLSVSSPLTDRMHNNNNNNKTIFERSIMAWTEGKGSVQMFIQYNIVYEKYESWNKYVLKRGLKVFIDRAFFGMISEWSGWLFPRNNGLLLYRFYGSAHQVNFLWICSSLEFMPSSHNMFVYPLFPQFNNESSCRIAMGVWVYSTSIL